MANVQRKDGDTKMIMPGEQCDVQVRASGSIVEYGKKIPAIARTTRTKYEHCMWV